MYKAERCSIPLHLEASQYDHVLTTEVVSSVAVEANSLTLDNDIIELKGPLHAGC